MNAFVEAMNGLGRWLVERLWQMSVELAVLAAVVVVVIYLLRVKSPALRHLFWCLVLAKPVVMFLIASPVSLYWFVRPEVVRPAAVAPAGPGAASYVPGRAPPMRRWMLARPGGAVATEAEPAPLPAWKLLDRYGVAALVWLAVASVLGLRLVVGFAYVGFLRHTARPQRDGPLVEILARAARATRTRRRVRIALSDVAHGPVLAGVLRPVILLPARLARQLPPEQMKLVLLHELAHLRRHDNLLLLVQRFAEMFLFFHPVVWLCGWAMRREAESACDDAVLSACGSSAAYAKSLARVAETRAGLSRRLLVNTFAAAESNFSRRVRRILKGRAARTTIGLSIASIAALVLVGCLGLPSASKTKAPLAPERTDLEKGTTMATLTGKYGFRRDPMKWAQTSRSVQAAMVRTFLLKQPKPADRQALQGRIDEILAGQQADGALSDDPRHRLQFTAQRLSDLAELGCPADRAEVAKAVNLIRRKAEPSPADPLGIYDVRAFCLLGLTDDAKTADLARAGLRRCMQQRAEWNGPYKGCPWTPIEHLITLWHGRELVETAPLVAKSLRWIADGLNGAGCLTYKDPWGFVRLTAAVDHPLAREILGKEVPLILRAQAEDGGWGDKSYFVFEALLRHELLEPLRKLPPLPADWKVVRSIPAPAADCFTLAWDGRRLWVGRPKAGEAIAVSTEDGKPLKRLKLPGTDVFGIGRWDDALAVTQPKAKRLVQVDPDSGQTRREIDLPKMEDVLGVTQAGGTLLVGDGFMCSALRIDPARPEEAEFRTLAGPGPTSLTAQDGHVWHFDFWAPALIKSSLDGRLLDWGEKPFAGRCDGLAWDGRQLWALDAREKRICAIEKTETGRALAAGAGGAAVAVEAVGAAPAKLRREGGKVWIEGGEKARWGRGAWLNSVMASLTVAMRAMGEDVTYEYLMGVSGRAFRLQVRRGGLCPSAPFAGVGFDCVPHAMKALGHSLEALQAEPDDADGVRMIKQTVVRSIDAGRPVLYASEEAGVVMGYADGGKVLLCRPYAAKGDGYSPLTKWPWGLSLIGAKTPPPPRRDSVLRSLRIALEVARAKGYGDEKSYYFSGFAAYEAWIASLTDEKRHADLGEAFFPESLGNAWCYDSLADARAAAGKYLRSVAADFQAPTAAHLIKAAELYEKVHQVVTAERPGLKCIGDLYPWELKKPENWTKQMRLAQAEALTEALALDRQAVAEIEKALAAEAAKPPAPAGA